jgi:hypothetical protein
MKKIATLLLIVGVIVWTAPALFAQAESTPFTTPTAPVNTNVTDATWDLLSSFNVANGGEQGIATDGNFYYTSKWSSTANGYINKYDQSGVKLDSFTVGVACPGIRDFAYDGQYYYGGQNTASLFKMDFAAHTLAGTTNTTQASIRHCAFDPGANGGAGGFWVGAWNTLALISRTGATLNTVSGFSLTSVYGSAYDNVTPGGPYLWLGDQNGSVSTAPTPQYIYQFSIPNMALTGVSHELADVPDYVLGDIIGGLEGSSTLFPGKFVLIGNMQKSPNKVFVYEMLTLGINDNEVHTVVKVYPNPAKENIFVTSSIYPIQNLTVTNQLGQVVYENNSEIIETRINTSDFQPGIYFVRVKTKDAITTEKVAIQ